MKRLLTLLSILMAVSASSARGAELVTSGQIGPVVYYAVHSTRSLKILLPWNVKVDLDDTGPASGSQRYYLNVYGELDTSLDRAEIQTLRGKFPGYKIDAAVPMRLGSITIDVGDGHPGTLPPPPVSQNFFSSGWFIDAKAGPAVWKALSSGQLPGVTISAQAKIPTVITGETYLLALSQICPQPNGMSTVKGLLAPLVRSLEPIYSNLKTADMKDLVLETALESCIQLGDSARIATISDVLELPASLTQGMQDKTLTTDRVDAVPTAVQLNPEVTATVHQ